MPDSLPAEFATVYAIGCGRPPGPVSSATARGPGRRMQDPPTLKRVLATLLGRPDEVMLELGAGGELLVAKVRALLSLLVLALPLVSGLLGPADSNEVLIGLGAAVFINIMAQVWLALARNPRRHRGLPFATGT